MHWENTSTTCSLFTLGGSPRRSGRQAQWATLENPACADAIKQGPLLLQAVLMPNAAEREQRELAPRAAAALVRSSAALDAACTSTAQLVLWIPRRSSILGAG